VDEPRTPEGNPFGLPLGEAWADAPLFREIQRVLLSSSGPVNWELARQVGIASASSSGEDPSPTAEDQRSFDEAVRVAEMHVSGFTGLETPNDLPKVEAVRRAQWIQANIESLRSLLEPAAAALADAIASAQPAAAPEGTPDIGAQLLQQISPLLLGAQVGSVLGALAEQVLGQYDIALPRPGGAGSLHFVVANIAAFERDWSLPPTDFRTWIAIHEVTHRFEFSRPWAAPRFRELLLDFLSTLTVDADGLRAKLETLDPSNPQGLQAMFEGDDSLFGTVLDDEQRLKLGRIQAFMAAAEGYGEHVTHAIGREMLPSYTQIQEAMRRYRESEHADPVFERLLGIEMKREQYALGRAFCDTVAEQTDEATLATMWDSAETLPSLPEVEEPRLWLARSV
jgi:putative hydrolase